MRAAILRTLGQPLEVANVEPPEQLTYGQVRVCVAYSGVCGSQLGEIDGVKGEDRFLPHLLGHEGSGTVLDVGPGVRTVAPGDRVVMHWMRGSGLEAEPPVYHCDGEQVNAGWITTLNELAVVSENRLTVLPPGLPMHLAPLLGCAVTTGLGVVVNDARLRIGESIIVLGTGGVGLSVVQGAALCCGQPIVAVDLHWPKLELAERLGATHTINASTQDVSDTTREILESGTADVVVENTGNPRMIELAYELTAPTGRTILVGVPPVGRPAQLHTLPLHFGKVLTGSHGGGTRPHEDIPRYAALARTGRLRLEELVTDRYTLQQVNEAVDDLRCGRVAGRCLIEIAPFEEPDQP